MTTTVHHQVEVIIVEEEVGEAEDEVVGVEEEVDSHPQKEIGPALIPRECFPIYYIVFYWIVHIFLLNIIHFSHTCQA